MGYDKTMKIETKGETMKTIKICVKGGVVQEVTIPKEYEDKIDYEIIDLDIQETKGE
jgi:hypothetical protein|tara:strand:- start:349 stop:519 length:171 start_codon:yes stop_codon:yes gene_type:complete